MKRLALTSLIISILLVVACSPSLTLVPLPELDDVKEALGYSLAPTQLPEGFEFSNFQLLESPKLPAPVFDEFTASVIYSRFKDYAYHSILITYPQSFSPLVSDNFIFEYLGLDWQRPDDAVSEVKLNGETAYLVRGSWSAETLDKLAHLDPDLTEYTPGWDYDMYLSLYFDFELSTDEIVGVMIRALLYPTEWITEKEMLKIAESIRRTD